jgi:hypothetical protein
MRFVVVAVVLGISLLLAGCPYESQVPLSSPDLLIDEAILGVWRIPDGEPQEVLVIAAFNAREYVLVVADDPIPAVTRMFLSVVGGLRLLNVVEISSEPGEIYPYYIAEYQVREDRLSYRLLDDELVGARSFENSEEFSRFVETHLDNEALFGEWETLERAE